MSALRCDSRQTLMIFSAKITLNLVDLSIPVRKLARELSFIELVKFSQRSDYHRDTRKFRR